MSTNPLMPTNLSPRLSAIWDEVKTLNRWETAHIEVGVGEYISIKREIMHKYKANLEGFGTPMLFGWPVRATLRFKRGFAIIKDESR